MAVSDVLITKLNALEAIAAQLGIEFNGDVGDIHRAIDQLKIHPNVSADFLPKLHEVLGLGNVFCENNIVSAIAELKKHNLAYKDIIRQAEVALKIGEGSFSYVDGCGYISNLTSFCENISKALDVEPSYYVSNDESLALAAIADLKNEAANSGNFLKALNETTLRLNGLVQSIEKIADLLGTEWDGSGAEEIQIIDAIADLKQSLEVSRKMVAQGVDNRQTLLKRFNREVEQLGRELQDEKLKRSAVDAKRSEVEATLRAIANYLGFEFTESPQTRDTLLGAIANLKHSLQLSQDENEELLEKVTGQRNRIIALEDESRSLRNHPIPQRNLIAQVKALKLEFEEIAAQLGIKFTGNTVDIFDAISLLKSSNRHEKFAILAAKNLEAIAKQLGFEYFDNDHVAFKIEKLQEKSAIAEQLQSDLINTDIGELRSERDHYRTILDKLCDRLKAPDIEALEHIAIHQEMDLDFTSQHNDDLRGKLVESQAMSLKYMNRIVELEREVRSLQDPANGLTDDENLKLLRVLLRAIP